MKAARGQTDPIVVTSFTVMEFEAGRSLQAPSMAVSFRAGLLVAGGEPRVAPASDHVNLRCWRRTVVCSGDGEVAAAIGLDRVVEQGLRGRPRAACAGSVELDA